MSEHLHTWAEPPDAVVAAEDTLDQASQAACRAVEEAVASWEAGVQADVFAPFSALIKKVQAAHDEALASLRGVESLSRAAQWSTVRTYVETVHARAVSPVFAHLEANDPVAVLRQLRTEADRETAAATAALPDLETVPLTGSLYHSALRDNPGIALGKLVRRNRHRLRALTHRTGNLLRRIRKRPVYQLAHPLRHVEARRVASARFSAICAPALDRSHRAAVDRLAPTIRTLERSVWEWTLGALRYLHEHDEAAFHQPEQCELQWKGSLPADGDLPPCDFADALTFPSFVGEDAAPVLHPDETLALLRGDFELAGTFLYRSPPTAYRRAAPAGERRLANAHDRLALCDGMLRLRKVVYDLEDALLISLSDAALEPLEDTYDAIDDRLAEIRDSAHALVEEAEGAVSGTFGQPGAPDPDVPDPDALAAGAPDPAARAAGAPAAEALETLLQKGQRQIEDLFRDLPGLLSADRALTRPGDHAWRGLMKEVASLPQSLRLLAVSGESPRTYTVDLLTLARRAFERPIHGRLAGVADQLRRSVARVWSETEQVEHVMATTFHTAIDALNPDIDTEQPEDAVTIITDGLRRAADSLRERYQTLGRDWTAVVVTLHDGLREDWGTVFRAVQSEDFLAQRVLGIQTRIARGTQRQWAKSVSWFAGVRESAVATTRLLRRRASTLVRLGRSAVGVVRTTREERHHAVDTVARARALYTELPLVYRRLFTLDPVRDRSLSANRDTDVDAMHEVIARWAEGQGSGAAVVQAPLGSGRTTFLRLVQGSLDERFRAVQLSLDARPPDEGELAGMLAAALYPDDSFLGDLAALERRIRERESSRAVVVLLDNLELVLLQVPGGSEMLRQVLLFFIRTDASIFWCCTVSSLAWQLATSSVPRAAALAQPHRLTLWSAKSMRDMVERRHRRSGISYTFDMPTEPAPLLRQRLRRARTEEAEQRILADDFFEALFRASGQNPSRALLEWVRAGTFATDRDRLNVRSLRAVSFAHLAQFDNDVAFALRALLVHNVMTVEDHAAVFNGSVEAGITVFETLLSEGLIESLDPESGSVIASRTPYRLHRLILQPVTRSLQERHFVY